MTDPLSYVLIIVALAGAAAGFLAGLLGIGGGLVIVPVIAWVLAGATDNAMPVAVATSIATIIFTASSSLISHQRKKAIDWRIFAWLTPGLILGGWVGARTVLSIDDMLLRAIFSGFCLLVGVQMVMGKAAAAESEVSGVKSAPGTNVLLTLAGSIIGYISALVGIGGGSLTVPMLKLAGEDMRRAIATSAACGLPIALSAATTFLWSGWHSKDAVESMVGLIHVPSWIVLGITGVLLAPLGAHYAHRWPRELLRRLFGGFLLIVATLLMALA